jgi:hypothetical protein
MNQIPESEMVMTLCTFAWIAQKGKDNRPADPMELTFIKWLMEPDNLLMNNALCEVCKMMEGHLAEFNDQTPHSEFAQKMSFGLKAIYGVIKGVTGKEPRDEGAKKLKAICSTDDFLMLAGGTLELLWKKAYPDRLSPVELASKMPEPDSQTRH